MKPILFNSEMVRAILDDRKTVTRRVIKQYVPKDVRFGYTAFTPRGCISGRGTYENSEGEEIFGEKFYRVPYSPGDILYVRETWAEVGIFHPNLGEYLQHYVYKASYSTDLDIPPIQWRPSIHMPKKAARIFLHVNNVRIEQLQDIDEAQARAEGAYGNYGFIRSPESEYNDPLHTAIEHFAAIWNRTTKPADLPRYGWDANPFVWVTEFERISREEAQL